jgi:hypothetical protein
MAGVCFGLGTGAFWENVPQHRQCDAYLVNGVCPKCGLKLL